MLTIPAKKIKEVLLQNADPEFEEFVRSKLGLIETQVLRTGMLANAEVTMKEPLALRMQDWWTLPLDKDAFVGPIQKCRVLVQKLIFQMSWLENFIHSMVRMDQLRI
jgi:hypothetical protein